MYSLRWVWSHIAQTYFIIYSDSNSSFMMARWCVSQFRTANDYCSSLESLRMNINDKSEFSFTFSEVKREKLKYSRNYSIKLESFHLPSADAFKSSKKGNPRLINGLNYCMWCMLILNSHRHRMLHVNQKKKLKRTQQWVRFWLFVELARRKTLRHAREHDLYVHRTSDFNIVITV